MNIVVNFNFININFFTGDFFNLLINSI